MFDIDVIASVADISQAEWSELAPNQDPLWSWSFFKMMECSRIGPDGFEYIVLKRAGKLAAILPLFWFRGMQLDAALGESWRRRVGQVRRLLPNFLCIPALFCGHPLAEGRLLVAEWAKVSDGHQLLEAVRTVAQQRRLQWIVFKDFDSQTVPLMFPHLSISGLFTASALPDAILDLPWSSFDEYLAHLKPKARQNIRSKMRKFERTQGLRLEVLDRFEHLVPQMTDLYQQVYDRAEMQLERLTPDFFYSLSELPDPEKELIVCWYHNRLIGFLLCLYSDEKCVNLRVGLDYEYAYKFKVYFNLYYENIRSAIRRRCHEINFCQTSYHTKLELGCRLASYTHIITHTNPLIRPVLQRYLPPLLNQYRHADLVQDFFSRECADGVE